MTSAVRGDPWNADLCIIYYIIYMISYIFIYHHIIYPSNSKARWDRPLGYNKITGKLNVDMNYNRFIWMIHLIASNTSLCFFHFFLKINFSYSDVLIQQFLKIELLYLTTSSPAWWRFVGPPRPRLENATKSLCQIRQTIPIWYPRILSPLISHQQNDVWS